LIVSTRANHNLIFNGWQLLGVLNRQGAAFLKILREHHQIFLSLRACAKGTPPGPILRKRREVPDELELVLKVLGDSVVCSRQLAVLSLGESNVGAIVDADVDLGRYLVRSVKERGRLQLVHDILGNRACGGDATAIWLVRPHCRTEWLQLRHAAAESLRVEDFQEGGETIRVPVVGRRGQKEAMFEPRRQVADGASDL
jgi:hypothetical protein